MAGSEHQTQGLYYPRVRISGACSIDLLSDSDSTQLMALHMSESQAGKINPIDFCLNSIDAFQNGVCTGAQQAQQTKSGV